MDTKNLRQKILDLAIRGKLVPQNPDDEPASVLLERIRAEKERLIRDGKIKRNKKPLKDTAHHVTDTPFEIPESWEWVRLEDFVNAVTDGDHQPPPQSPTGVPFLVISDVNTGRIVFDKARFVDEQYYVSLPIIRKAEKGDILFTVTGSYGIVIPVETEDKFCFQRHIGLIKTFDCTQWLTLALQSDYVRSYCDKVATGTAQKTVSLGHLRDLFIPVPPVDEQMRIAKVVDNWISVIDQIMKDTSSLTSSIAIAKSKILNLAIHGKLVPQDPNDEPAIELLRRINPKFETCENTQYKNIPRGWEICTINDIASSELGKTLDKEKNKGEYKPYLCSINVFWNKFNLSEMKQMRFEDNELEHYSIHQGDLVICEGGDAGRCAVWPYSKEVLFQNAIHRVRFKENIDSYFYMYIIMYLKNNHILDKYCKGVTIKHFTKTALLSLCVPLPPRNEQFRIVAKINELFTTLDEIKESLEA